MTSAELLLHPVRLRIVQAFLGDRALTTSQLHAELPDVPPASLYRHVARLVERSVLSVVAERRVRGALERTYIMRAAAARISADEAAKMSAEEHRQAFLAFVAGLIGDAERYLARPDIDPLRTGQATTWPAYGSMTSSSWSSRASCTPSSSRAWPTVRDPGVPAASSPPCCFPAPPSPPPSPAAHDRGARHVKQTQNRALLVASSRSRPSRRSSPGVT